MQRARVTWPDAQVMADGRVRIPATLVALVTVNGQNLMEWAPDMGWEVEPIPDTQDWEADDAARDANGELFVMRPNGRWLHALGMNLDPVLPMTKLVVSP